MEEHGIGRGALERGGKGGRKSCLRGEKFQQGGEGAEEERQDWGRCQLRARVAVVR